MSTATVTSNGRITIPQDVRSAIGLAAGDKVEFVRMQDGHFAVFAATGSIKSVKGIIPKPTKPVSLDEMQRAIEESAAGNDRLGKSIRPFAPP